MSIHSLRLALSESQRLSDGSTSDACYENLRLLQECVHRAGCASACITEYQNLLVCINKMCKWKDRG